MVKCSLRRRPRSVRLPCRGEAALALERSLNCAPQASSPGVKVLEFTGREIAHGRRAARVGRALAPADRSDASSKRIEGDGSQALAPSPRPREAAQLLRAHRRAGGPAARRGLLWGAIQPPVLGRRRRLAAAAASTPPRSRGGPARDFGRTAASRCTASPSSSNLQCLLVQSTSVSRTRFDARLR